MANKGRFIKIPPTKTEIITGGGGFPRILRSGGRGQELLALVAMPHRRGPSDVFGTVEGGNGGRFLK